ncbi:MAG: 50S ribosomal protein L3 [Holosporaceae bacterium]|jgi:large subunit ribosomal protein L3|nr:50S ribosomal protein L3 [Holosporaceae bacterium]
MISGLLGKKLGMTRILSDNGRQYAVTVLKVEQHEVLFCKTVEKHGYDAAVVGTVEAEERKISKPMRGYFKALGKRFFKRIKEFRLPADKLPEVGSIYGADLFSSGQFVDVSAVSIGKGFAGAMKRHNFGGLRASHGVSLSHRSHGSTGNREDPGKVFKGKKMAGHLGNKQVTIQNLRVHGVDGDLLLLRGGVPGPEGGYVLVKCAIKKEQPQ